MNFCRLSREYVREGYTEIDNVFLSGYLPEADSLDVKIYLYGLWLAGTGRETDNSIERISLSLKVTEERIMRAFSYWEELGLVSIGKSSPVTITYNSVKTPVTPVVKYNAKEYGDFVEEIRRIFPERELPPQDILRYVELMRGYKVEPNAMLLIARYCRDARGTTNTAYVLSVAANWAKEGVRTEADVNARLDEFESNLEAVRSVYATLGLRSAPSVEDREMYVRWTKEYGFGPDAVLTAARACKKRGGIRKLASYIEELHAAGVTTAAEAEAYRKSKEEARDLAEELIRNLGCYYASLDMPIETYVNPWLGLGFEKGALLKLAKFCFLRNVRTLDGMNVYVEKLHKLGIVTERGIENYVARQIAIDAKIREVLAACNSEGAVTARDRDFYRTFVEIWGFEHETVLRVATAAAGKPFPMSYINKLLLIMKENGIRSVSEADAFLSDGNKGNRKSQPKENYIAQEYTAEEISSVFRSLDEIDPDEEDI